MIHATPKSSAAVPHGPSIPFMLVIYVMLMVLLLLTVAAAHFPLGPLSLIISLAIAAAKAVLVILFYMHVRYSSRVTWIFVIAGFIWLLILFSLTFAEYVGRMHLNRAQPLNHEHLEPRGFSAVAAENSSWSRPSSAIK